MKKTINIITLILLLLIIIYYFFLNWYISIVLFILIPFTFYLTNRDEITKE